MQCQSTSVSSNLLWAARQGTAAFERWQDWLEPLGGRLASLVRTLETGDGAGSSAAPVAVSATDTGPLTHYPAHVVAAELEQIIGALHISSATGAGGGGDTAMAGAVARPPSSFCARLLLDTGLSYGAILDMYCSLLRDAQDPPAAAVHPRPMDLQVVEGEAFTVDPAESAIATDAYQLQLLESGVCTLVQWLQVATKHSVARSKANSGGGGANNALAELVRYNSKAVTAKPATRRTRQAAAALSGAYDEEKEGQSSSSSSGGRLSAIFAQFSSALDVLSAPLPIAARAPVPLAALAESYGRLRGVSLAKLGGELRAASLLQQRFISEM